MVLAVKAGRLAAGAVPRRRSSRPLEPTGEGTRGRHRHRAGAPRGGRAVRPRRRRRRRVAADGPVRRLHRPQARRGAGRTSRRRHPGCVAGCAAACAGARPDRRPAAPARRALALAPHPLSSVAPAGAVRDGERPIPVCESGESRIPRCKGCLTLPWLDDHSLRSLDVARRTAGSVRRSPDLAGDGGVVLVGHPNVGKSVLFQRLTGRYVLVSNYPGNDGRGRSRRGAVRPAARPSSTRPGIVAFPPRTRGRAGGLPGAAAASRYGAVVQVGDAKSLARTLLLFAQLAELRVPMALGPEHGRRGGRAGRGRRLARCWRERLGIPVAIRPRDARHRRRRSGRGGPTRVLPGTSAALPGAGRGGARGARRLPARRRRSPRAGSGSSG